MTKIILLIGVGLALIVAEVLIPSMGVLGTLASVCLIGAVGWSFTISVGTGLQVMIATFLLVPTVVMLAFKLLPYSPLAKRLMATGFSFEDGRGVDQRDEGLVGRVGTVEAPLRPVGTARIDGRRVDVVSRGDMVEAGTTVRVIEVEGNRVVVTRHVEEKPA